MSEAIKLNDNKYIDTTGLYDVSKGATQAALNSTIDRQDYWVEANSSIYIYNALNSIIFAVSTNGGQFGVWVTAGYQHDNIRSIISRLDSCSAHSLVYGPTNSNYFIFTNTNSQGCTVKVLHLN